MKKISIAVILIIMIMLLPLSVSAEEELGFSARLSFDVLQPGAEAVLTVSLTGYSQETASTDAILGMQVDITGMDAALVDIAACQTLIEDESAVSNKATYNEDSQCVRLLYVQMEDTLKAPCEDVLQVTFSLKDAVNTSVVIPVSVKLQTVSRQITLKGSCTVQCAVQNRVIIDDKTNADKVWIDGVEYSIQTTDDRLYVDLPDGNAKTMVIHTYGEKNGKEYPVGMKVWTLENNDGFYTATRLEEFDDILQYAGSSIRVTGKKGIRMITAIDQEKKKDLITDGLAGYTLKEYGTVIAWASQINADKPLVLGKPYVKSNYAYKQGVADPIFAYKDGKMQYTNVLVNFSDEQCKKDIAMRPYMILTDGENDITLYGGIVERSIGYIAAQNAYTFDSEKPEEKDAHDYIWNIILYVYGEDFVPEKA